MVLDESIKADVNIPQKYYKQIIGAKGKTINSIERDFNVKIKIPNSKASNNVQITGLAEDVEKVKCRLNEICSESDISAFSSEIRVKQEFHKFLIGKSGSSIDKIRQNTGAKINFPEISSSDKDLIVISGTEKSVDSAKAQLEAIIKDLDNITDGDVTVDPKYHKHFIAKRGEVLNRIAEDCGGVLISFPRPGTDSSRVSLKGGKESIVAAKKRILEIVSDLEHMITIDCVIQQKHHRIILGPRGSRQKNVTSEFDVQIKFPDRDDPSDIIKISGEKSKCEAAKKALLELIPIEEEITVPFELHRSIIGQKGRYVRELINKFDVHIELSPPDQKLDIIKISGAPENVKNVKVALFERVKELQMDQDKRNSGSYSIQLEIDPALHSKIIGRKGVVINKIRNDHGVQILLPRREDTITDVITIQGEEASVEAARTDIMKIVNDINEQVKVTVSIDNRVHSRLIGQRGRNIIKFMDDYQVEVIFPRAGETNGDKNLVTIMGKEECCNAAKIQLEHLVKDIDNMNNDTVIVDPKYHKYFVAKRGEILQQISENNGGVQISFPKYEAHSSRVTLRGTKENVDSAKKRILEIVNELGDMITIECIIPRKHHRALMGPRGSTLQSVTSKYDVQIKFPDRDLETIETLTQLDTIKITGKAENCESAKDALHKLIPVAHDFEVPFELHGSIIGQRGRSVRELMDRYDVHIELPPSEKRLNIIKISGAPDKVEEAKIAIAERVQELQDVKQDRESRTFEIKMDIDPALHSKIIGRKGNVVNKIRSEHSVQILFPSRGEQNGNIVKIQGNQPDCEAAQDDILNIIKDSNEGSKAVFEIDNRIHSRLIGRNGNNVHKIMEEFQVNITFPKSGDSNLNSVIVTGTENNVADAKDHLLNLEEEYLQDVSDLDVHYPELSH